MRPIIHLAVAAVMAVSLIAARAALADDSATPAPEAPATKIGKSRSNIQNNREAPPAKDAEAPAADESAAVVKTKTKSNQSND